MKARDIALLALAILFPVGVFWFIMSPDAVRWVINGMLALPPAVLTSMAPVGIGSTVAILLALSARKRKESAEEPDAGRDGFGRY